MNWFEMVVLTLFLVLLVFREFSLSKKNLIVKDLDWTKTEGISSLSHFLSFICNLKHPFIDIKSDSHTTLSLKLLVQSNLL